jgi:N-acetylmuramoyl-L-alanine amidase
MTARAARPAIVGVAAIFLLLLPVLSPGATAPPRPAPGTSVSIEGGSRVVLRSGRDLVLAAAVAKGEGWTAFTRRLCDPSVAWTAVRKAGGGASQPARGQVVELPFALLSEAMKVRVLRAAFPADGTRSESGPGGEERVWVHSPALSPLETWGEGLWEAAFWFTGDGARFTRLRRSGAPGDPQLLVGETVMIPVELLRPGLRPLVAPDAARAAGAPDWPKVLAPMEAVAETALPGLSPDVDAASAPHGGEAPGSTSGLEQTKEHGLTYGSDARGRFAIYPLKPGEALYSAVVVRYTGRVDPDEVNEVAAEIQRVNGIADVTAIPVGYRVKIPLELLEPEFLPAGDPLRADYDRTRAEAQKFRNPEKARNLEGVHVILDAGHGGVDPGAIANGVNEHEYVYDVMCRLKKKLEDETGAVVHPIVRDTKIGYSVRDARTLRADGAEEILTDPRHVNEDSSDTTVGVNLRWYLANSILRKLTASGTRPDRVVFLSLHADSLHPSLRGGMVYIPGERYRRGTFGSTSGVYSRYREAREKSLVSFTRDDRLRSEGLSRELAGQIVDSMRRQKLAVHPDLPVRDRIIRRKRAWVPAVLRANQVPAKVLVEIANLNNVADARLLQDAKFRDRSAAALVDALTRYFRKP